MQLLQVATIAGDHKSADWSCWSFVIIALGAYEEADIYSDLKRPAIHRMLLGASGPHGARWWVSERMPWHARSTLKTQAGRCKSCHFWMCLEKKRNDRSGGGVGSPHAWRHHNNVAIFSFQAVLIRRIAQRKASFHPERILLHFW